MEEVPFEDRHVPQSEIHWARSAWWWIPLSRSPQPSIKMTTLVLSLLAMWVAQVGIWLGVMLFSPADSDGQKWSFGWNSFSSEQSAFAAEQPEIVAPTEFAEQSGNVVWPNFLATSSPILAWLSNGYTSVASLEPGPKSLAFLSFVALWLTLSFSLLGGVLARRAMVELGQQSIAPWGESFSIVFSRWLSFLWATGMHLVGLAGLLLPFALLGLLARAGSMGATIAGICLLIAFPLVFAVGRLMMSMVFCYPLSVCAISAEKKADAFEGFSRSNAYLFQRPVVAVLCVLVLMLVGLVGEQLVLWTLSFGWALISGLFLYVAGNERQTAVAYVETGSLFIGQLLSAYWFSFFWSASAAVYLILRRSVDSTELHEIDSIEDPVETTLPEIPRTPPESTSVESEATKASEDETNEPDSASPEAEKSE